MGKDKLRKFRENETFKCLIQPSTSEVLNCDHPLKGNWGRDVFGNDNPIVVELGCGKGDYTVDLAERNPSCNYIGVDIKGARLWKGAKYATEHALGNVAFLRTRIEFIESLFAENEISEIWITFADPQIGREKKRLTAPLFMNRYRNFLCKGGIIHLKTDSQFMFRYTLAMIEENALPVQYQTFNLYEEGVLLAAQVPNIQTFYEKQWLDRGLDIKYVRFGLEHEHPWQEPDVEIEPDEYRSFGRSARVQ